MGTIQILFYIAVTVTAVSSNENIVIGDDSNRVLYETPAFHETDVYFIETFDNKNEFSRTWVKSDAKKDTTDEALSKYDGEWEVEPALRDALPGDLGMVLKSKAKHAAIAGRLKRPFVFSDHPLIVQYEVLLQDGQECGGAYLKLLSADKNYADLTKFHDKTPYSIMFGPDKCGNDHKLHFIFRHKNPKTGLSEEKHSKKPNERIDEHFTDKKPHLYRLILEPGNTFKVFVDHNLVNSGSLLEDFTPPVNPPAEIDDPNDKKPSDWDDREKIPDMSATKPENWNEDAPQTIEDPAATKPDGWLDNEPLHIRDPFAEKPDDWDEDMDGEWEAPLVPNPACEEAAGCGTWNPPVITNPEYKGKWYPPMIDNPNYQGKWTPKRIPNPNYFEDKNPFKMAAIGAVGFELWSMSPNILFDNIIITSKTEIADKLAAQTFDLKKRLMEMDAETMWVKIMKSINYMPGWWSLYFVYCSLPIAAYAWYLYRRVQEDTFVSRFVSYTNKHPWLWAVYVVILLIPITLIVVFCFGSSKEKDQFAADAKRKKTDEPEADDDKTDGQVDAIDDQVGNCTNDLAVEEISNSPNGPGEGDTKEECDTTKNTEVVESIKSEEVVPEEISEQINSNEAQLQNNKSTSAAEEDTENDTNIKANSEELHDSSLRRRCQRID